MKNLNFIFFGASRFAIPILEALKIGEMSPKLIITTPDKPAGRGLKPAPSPVKIWAQKNNIPFLQPEKLDESFAKKLQATSYKLAIVAAYGKIIPKQILEISESGSLNIHPSLLPRWRGADPIRAALLAGDKETGLTIMLMDEKMDHGPILKSRNWNLETGKYNYEELEQKLARTGGQLLIETIPKWLAGEIKPRKQNHLQATYTKKITKENGHIDWNEPAEIIERKIRALNPWPGTFTFWNEKRVKILEADEFGNAVTKQLGDDVSKPGKVFKYNSKLAVWCGKNAILIKKLQLEGKKPADGKDFLSGYSDIIGVVLS